MADDGDYRLSQFYLLRPAGLTYLLSLMVVFDALMRAVDLAWRPAVALSCTVAALLMTLPVALTNLALIYAKYPSGHRLLATLSPTEREVLDWIRAKTDPQDAIAVEPIGRGSIMEGDAFPGGLERLSGRGFIVNYKYIPTDKADLLRWYQLLQARRAFFRGDCSQNARLGADYAVLRLREGTNEAGHCLVPVYSNKEFLIGRVSQAPAGGSPDSPP